jgi:large subunit ribosomal protein L19
MKKEVIEFNKAQRATKAPALQAGDIVRVHRKIKEAGKERIQVFEGIIIAIKGRQSSSPLMTVRKVSGGIGVELILPIHSSSISKIEVVKRAKIRRSKLYYIRNKSAKSLRMKYKELSQFAKTEEEKEAVVENEEVKKEEASEKNEEKK